MAGLVLLSSVPLFMLANKNFLPNDDQSEFEVGLRAPEGTSLEATEIVANRIATHVRQLPEVAYTLVTVGDDPARSRRRPEDAAPPAAAHVEHSALEGGIKGLEIGVHALAPVGDPEIVGESARHASLRAAAA